MAFKKGAAAFVALDGVDGTPVNISAYADNVSLPNDLASLDVTTFSATDMAFIPGLGGGGQVSISGPADVALGTVLGGLLAAHKAGSTTSTIQYGPGGSVSGQVKQSAETYLTNYTMSNQIGGRADYTLSLQITGAITNTTW